jgi:hypothetical protein
MVNGQWLIVDGKVDRNHLASLISHQPLTIDHYKFIDGVRKACYNGDAAQVVKPRCRRVNAQRGWREKQLQVRHTMKSVVLPLNDHLTKEEKPCVAKALP